MKCEYCNWPEELGHYRLCALKTHNTKMWKKGFSDAKNEKKNIEPLSRKKESAYWAGWLAGYEERREEEQNKSKVCGHLNFLAELANAKCNGSS